MGPVAGPYSHFCQKAMSLPNHASHELYTTGDSDTPECVMDRNGEVVLGMCRHCGKAEIELAEPCCAPEFALGLHICPACLQLQPTEQHVCTPVNRRHLVVSAGYWFNQGRQAQAAGKSAEAIMAFENAYNHVENALATGLTWLEALTGPGTSFAARKAADSRARLFAAELRHQRPIEEPPFSPGDYVWATQDIEATKLTPGWESYGLAIEAQVGDPLLVQTVLPTGLQVTCLNVDKPFTIAAAQAQKTKYRKNQLVRVNAEQVLYGPGGPDDKLNVRNYIVQVLYPCENQRYVTQFPWGHITMPEALLSPVE